MLSIMLNKDIQDWNQYILQYYNDTLPPYVSGIEIKATEIYSICPGKVIAKSWSFSSKWSVTVLVNSNQIIRYINLHESDVTEGQQLGFRTFIGIANKFVRFEYCTPIQNESKWPVRIKSLTMYKHNPLGLLSGDIKLQVIVDNVQEAKGDEDLISRC